MRERERRSHGPPGQDQDRCLIRTYAPAARSTGFSLIELLAVLAVIGIALAVVLPRLSSFDESLLASDAERLSTLVAYLDERAAARRTYYRLSFDMRAEGVRVESSPDGREYGDAGREFKALALNSGVAIEEVRLPGAGAVRTGEPSVVISPAGGEPFEVLLSAGGRSLVVSYNPFTGKAGVGSR